MPALVVYTDPLKPGICQVPVFSVGDDTAWTLRFNNGTAYYDPGSVSVRLGYVVGLENISYPSSFRFVDRLNYQSVGTFSIAAAVPGSLSWDINPNYYEGGNGAWLIRGTRPPSGQIGRIYVIQGAPGGLVYNSLLVGPAPSGGDTATATASTTDLSDNVISAQMTAFGSGYTSAPTVGFSGGGGSGAAATAIINGQGQVTAVVITNQGSGYSSAPAIGFTSGGGSGAAATASLGVANTVTSATVTSGGDGYTSLPPVYAKNGSAQIIPSIQLEAAGMEFNDKPFVRDPVTLEVMRGVTLTPVWNGRLNSAGAKVYDDGLLIIHPRILLSPSFSVSGTTYSGTMDPVTTFIKAVLRYRRSATMDIEIFGAGRLLFIGSLTVYNASS